MVITALDILNKVAEPASFYALYPDGYWIDEDTVGANDAGALLLLHLRFKGRKEFDQHGRLIQFGGKHSEGRLDVTLPDGTEVADGLKPTEVGELTIEYVDGAAYLTDGEFREMLFLATAKALIKGD